MHQFLDPDAEFAGMDTVKFENSVSGLGKSYSAFKTGLKNEPKNMFF